MLKSVILWKLDGVERELGASVDYVREIVRTSLRAFLKFAKIISIAEYSDVLPRPATAVARIVATRDEDCGSCVQIEVGQATKDGVPADVIDAALRGRPAALPDDLRTVYDFATAVVTATYDEEPLRVRIRELYGDRGLVELALVMASARFFPIVKRTLGHATSCSVPVGPADAAA